MLVIQSVTCKFGIMISHVFLKSRLHPDRILVLPVQSLPITTNVVSLNLAHGKVHSKQHYVIKFVSDLWKVCGFLWVLRFPPLIKLTAAI